MKSVILIFSVIVSIFGLLISQLLYPLIASWFDGGPSYVAAIIGFVVFLIITILINIITKEKFIRRAIIIPCFISAVAAFGITLGRFYWNVYYHNGYCEHDGLKNCLGITIIDNYGFFSKGVDSYGNEVIVCINRQEDYTYESERKEKYDYSISWYYEDGSYINSVDFSKYYYEGDKLHDLYTLKDSKYLIEYYTDISIYQRIG